MIKEPNTWKAWSSASTKLSMDEGLREDENAEEEEEGEAGCLEVEDEEEGEGCKDEEPGASLVNGAVGLRVSSCFPFLVQGW